MGDHGMIGDGHHALADNRAAHQGGPLQLQVTAAVDKPLNLVGVNVLLIQIRQSLVGRTARVEVVAVIVLIERAFTALVFDLEVTFDDQGPGSRAGSFA